MSEMKFQNARVIGEKLREARQNAGISLRELAKKADISASMLSQIETGKAYPSVRSIYDIAAALDLPVDYFFPEQDTEHASQRDPQSEMTPSDMREAMINRSVEPALVKGSPSPVGFLAA